MRQRRDGSWAPASGNRDTDTPPGQKDKPPSQRVINKHSGLETEGFLGVSESDVVWSVPLSHGFLRISLKKGFCH
ncbi:hypothetical protein FKM82_024583 [Ascaphus truei]